MSRLPLDQGVANVIVVVVVATAVVVVVPVALVVAAVVVAVVVVVAAVAADARKPKRIEMVSHISSFQPQSRLHFRNGGFTSNWKRTSWASKSKTKTKTNIG